MNNRANPEIYPYSYDDTKLYQVCTSRLRDLTSLIGSELEPSIWLGNAEAYQLGITFWGFPVDKVSRLEWTVQEPRMYIRQTTEFGLAEGSSGNFTSRMNVNVELISPAIDASGSFSFTNFRRDWNAFRWAEAKEEVNSTAYQYYPVVYIKKGALCAFFTIKAVGELPESFQNQTEYENFLSNPAFTGTLEEWNAVKETYPNITEITVTIRATATAGTARNTTLTLFYKQVTTANGGVAGMWNGGTFNYYYPQNDPKEYQYIGGNIVPAQSTAINYFATNVLFRTMRVYVRGLTESTPYGVTEFRAWGTRTGIRKYRFETTDVVNSQGCICTVPVSFYDGDPNDLLDFFTNMGFAVTDQGNNKATNGNIKTDPHIWTPTYDDNGNIDGRTNDETEKTEYVDSGDNIQPNFDPYGGDDEPEEDYPDEDPSEDQETDHVDLPDVTLNSTGVFNRTYVINKHQLQLLSDYLWNPDPVTWDEIIEDLKLVGDNRMNSIINVIMFPFEIPRSEESHLIRIGRHTTTETAHYLGDAPNVFDMGTCYFWAKFQNFLDYEPYTQAWLYIPFCGVIKVPSQQFMNKTINVKIALDYLTGSGQAVIFSNGIPVMYRNCTIGLQVPVTGSDSGYTIRNYLKAASGGLSAIGSTFSGNFAGALGSVIDSAVSFISAQNAPVQSEGSASPQCGIFMPNKCYFIVERAKPLMSKVPDYGRLVGYACYRSGLISQFNGFSKFENVKLDISHCTDTERNEIINLLRTGVYL